MTESFDLLPCAFISFRDDGTVLGCNNTLCAWLAYTKDDLIGKNIEYILTLPSRIFYNTHFFPLLMLQTRAEEIFLTLKRGNGESIPVLANAKREGNEENSVIYCIFIQVNERKKFEEELIRAKNQAENAVKENQHLLNLSKSLEQQSIELEIRYRDQIATNENLIQFSKIVSHDLQEPIRKLQILSDLIITDTDSTLSPRSKQASVKIVAQAKRLKELTKTLQQYVSIVNTPLYELVDLNGMISAAKVKAAQSRSFNDLDVDIENLPAIEGYPQQLEMLFFHLFDNAIKFRHPGRRLQVRVTAMVFDDNIFKMTKDKYKYAQYVRIKFYDNGVGFSNEYSDYVFQLLNKIDQSIPGLGIGLSLVKRIVNNHNGEIRVISEPGVGTQFEIELPLRMKER
jgi:phosphoserine phosphatase RsbU/P